MKHNAANGLSSSTSVSMEDKLMEEREKELVERSDVELSVLGEIQSEIINEDPKSTSILSEGISPCAEMENAEISENMFQNKVNINLFDDQINSNSSHSTGSGSMSIGLITTSMSSNSSKIKLDHSKDINNTSPTNSNHTNSSVTNNSNTNKINYNIFNKEKIFQDNTEQAESFNEKNHMSIEQNSHSTYNMFHDMILNSNLSSNLSNLNGYLDSNSLFRLSVSENQSKDVNVNQNFPEESERFTINRNCTNSNNSIYGSTINGGIGDNKTALSFVTTINHFKFDFENNNNNILETVSRKGLMFLLTVQEVFLHKIKKKFCLKCNNDVNVHEKIEEVFKEILKLKIEKQTNEIYIMNFLQRLKNDFINKFKQVNEKLEGKDQVIHRLQNQIQQLTSSVKIYAQDLSSILNDEELELSRFKITIHNHFLHFTDFVFQLFIKIYSLCSEKMERLHLVVSRLKAFQEKEKKKKKENNNNKRKKIKSKKNTIGNEKNEVKKYIQSSGSSNDSVLLDMEFEESSSSLEKEEKIKNEKLEQTQNKEKKRKKKTERDMKKKKKKEKHTSDEDDNTNSTSVNSECSSIESSVDEEKKNTSLKKNRKIEKYNEIIQKYKKKYIEEKQKNKTLHFLVTNKDEEIDHMKKRIKEDHDQESFYETEKRKNYKELNDLKMLLEEHRYDNTHLLNKNRELQELNMDLTKKLESSCIVEKQLNIRIQELMMLYDKEREKNSALLTENIDLKNQISQINDLRRNLEMKYRMSNANQHDYEVGFSMDDPDNNYPLCALEHSKYPLTFQKDSRNPNKNMYDSFIFDYTKDSSVKAYKKHYENYLKRMVKGEKCKQEKTREIMGTARNRSASNSYKSYKRYEKNRYMSNERENQYRKRREDYSISDESYYRNNSRRCSSYNSNHSINVKTKPRKANNSMNRKQKEKRKKREEIQSNKKEEKLEETKDPIKEQVKKDIKNFDEKKYKKMINNITMEEKEIEKIKDEDLYSIFMQNWKESIATEQICQPDSLNFSVSFLNNLNDSGVFLSKDDKDEKGKIQNPNWCEPTNPVYEKEQYSQGFQKEEHERKDYHLNSEVRSLKATIVPEKQEGEEISNAFIPPKESVTELEKNRETGIEDKDILMTYEMYKKNKEKFMHLSLKKNFENANKNTMTTKQTLQNLMRPVITNINNKEEYSNINVDMNGPFSDIDPSQTPKENFVRDLNTSTFDSKNLNSISINSSVNEIMRTLKQGCDNNEINFFQTSPHILQKKEHKNQNHKNNSIQIEEKDPKHMSAILGIDNTLVKNVEPTENLQPDNIFSKQEIHPNEKEFIPAEKEKISNNYNIPSQIENIYTHFTTNNNKTLSHENKEHFISNHVPFNINKNLSNPSKEMNQLNGLNNGNDSFFPNPNFKYSQGAHAYINKEEGFESVRKKEPRTSGVLSRFSRLK